MSGFDKIQVAINYYVHVTDVESKNKIKKKIILKVRRRSCCRKVRLVVDFQKRPVNDLLFYIIRMKKNECFVGSEILLLDIHVCVKSRKLTAIGGRKNKVFWR